MLTPALAPLFIAYNTGADGGILRTICIVRKYCTQETASNPVFGSLSGICCREVQAPLPHVLNVARTHVRGHRDETCCA
jgi:hypothetical protein